MQALLSEGYFQGLLGQPEGAEALSQFWSRRADDTAALFGLTAPEYAVQLILIYVGEVGNGGHVQFFVNRGTVHVADTIAALQDVGLGELAQTLSVARVMWEGRGAALRGTEIAQQLAGLDGCLYSTLTQVSARLTAYLTQHQDRVLTAERGLV